MFSNELHDKVFFILIWTWLWSKVVILLLIWLEIVDINMIDMKYDWYVDARNQNLKFLNSKSDSLSFCLQKFWFWDDLSVWSRFCCLFHLLRREEQSCSVDRNLQCNIWNTWEACLIHQFESKILKEFKNNMILNYQAENLIQDHTVKHEIFSVFKQCKIFFEIEF